MNTGFNPRMDTNLHKFDEGLGTCAACGHGYDVATEDPQFPGNCRECGDKKRGQNSESRMADSEGGKR